jgi:hypothetical protein
LADIGGGLQVAGLMELGGLGDAGRGFVILGW